MEKRSSLMELSTTETPTHGGSNRDQGGNGIPTSGIPTINPTQISAQTTVGPLSPVQVGRITSASISGQSGQNTPRAELSDDDNNNTNNNTNNKNDNNNNDINIDKIKVKSINGINIEEFTKNMTERSRAVIFQMDKDGDGVITYDEAASYGKHVEKETKKWRNLFFLSIILLFIIFGIIFGLFILGFELTKTTDIDNSDHNALITTNGEKVTTVTGEESIDITQFWDIDIDDNIDIDDLIIRYIHGYFGGHYHYIQVSYFIKYDIPEYLEIFDNSGNIYLEYYNNISDSIYNNQFILYQTLPNGTQIIKQSDYEITRRRLQTVVIGAPRVFF